jgi:uncharacterized protein (UPF0297 family)
MAASKFSYEKFMAILDAVATGEMHMDKIYEYVNACRVERDTDDGLLTSDQECNILEKINTIMPYEQMVDFYDDCQLGNYIFSEIYNTPRGIRLLIDLDMPTGSMEYYLLFDMAHHAKVEFTDADIKTKKRIMKSYFIDAYKMKDDDYYNIMNQKIFNCIMSGDRSYYHLYQDFHEYIWMVVRSKTFTQDADTKREYRRIMKLYLGKYTYRRIKNSREH